MRLLYWPWRKRPQRPSITAEISEDGNIVMRAAWPKSTTPEGALKSARETANLGYLLCTGALSAQLCQSVLACGQLVGEHGTAELVNKMLDQGLTKYFSGLHASKSSFGGGENAPLVHPLTVFAQENV